MHQNYNICDKFQMIIWRQISCFLCWCVDSIGTSKRRSQIGEVKHFFSCTVYIKEGYFKCVLDQDSLRQHVIRASSINRLLKFGCYSLRYEPSAVCLLMLFMVLCT